MSGLVLELQRDALDANVNVDALLRKALVVSRKLDLPDVQQWIDSELKGYDSEAEIPEYRKLTGEAKVFNPYRGWQPVIIDDPELHEMITSRSIGQSVSELQDLLRKDGTLMMKYSPVPQAAIMRMIGHQLEPALFITRQSLVKVCDAVRNQILDWSLDLEKQNILGSGLTFTKEEKVAAKETNYITNIGSMVNSQLQQHSSGSQMLVSSELAERIDDVATAIEKSFEKLSLDSTVMRELETEIATLRLQLNSPKPKIPVLKECLLSARTILEGCVGNVGAAALLAQIGPILPLLG